VGGQNKWGERPSVEKEHMKKRKGLVPGPEKKKEKTEFFGGGGEAFSETGSS